MQHVVLFSGGISSWGAAKLVAEWHGVEQLTLLFADTRAEDEDVYRFLDEAAANVFGAAPPRLVKIADGRTPWQVFEELKFLGTAWASPCSDLLKRKVTNDWLRANCDRDDTVVHVGIDWTEEHRFLRMRDKQEQDGWRFEAPLCMPPYVWKEDWLKRAEKEGLRPPRQYALGFPHANCPGCVKTSFGGWAHLLKVWPERYAYHEQKEQDMRALTGRKVSMLRRRQQGRTVLVTLRELRESIEAGGTVDRFDIGGCGCFVDESDGEEDNDGGGKTD